MDIWREIKSDIETHSDLGDKKALDSDIRKLFNRFRELPPDESWELAINVYENFKNYTPLNMAFSIGIPQNYDILPDKEEAWEIFIKIPDNVDPILFDESKYYIITELQIRSQIFDSSKVWELLKKYSNDDNPKVRGTAGYTICEYIALKDDFPTEEGWQIIDKLINDPTKEVKERVSRGFSDFYHELPQEKINKYQLGFLKENSKEIKEINLDIAIQQAKEYAENRNYSDGIKSLKIVLNNLKQYSIGVMIGISAFILFFIFLIYIVKDLWVFILYNAPFLLLVPITTVFIIWKILKFEFSWKMLAIFLLTVFIPLFFLYPLIYSIYSFIFSINLKINIFLILGIIVSNLIICLTILPYLIFFIGNAMKLLMRSKNFHLANGLYNYFKGRRYVLNYLENENSRDKLIYLKKAIKNFSKSVKSYEKLQFGLEKELSLCPYCLNFYQGLEIYEKSLDNPDEPKIKKLEKKIEKSRSIMNETGNGSEKLNKALTELVHTIKILTKLKENIKKSSNMGVTDKLKLDEEIKKRSTEIAIILQNINEIISEIEDQDLPIILNILKSKSVEISNINKFTKKGLTGYNELFLRNKYDKISIFTLIIGLFILILGYILTLYALSLIGIIFTVISTVIIAYPSFKKTKQY